MAPDPTGGCGTISTCRYCGRYLRASLATVVWESTGSQGWCGPCALRLSVSHSIREHVDIAGTRSHVGREGSVLKVERPCLHRACKGKAVDKQANDEVVYL